jgi:hypothetical protein
LKKEKSIKIYEYGFHELHNDSEAGRMGRMIIQWCKKMVESDKRIAFIRNVNYGICQIDHNQKKTGRMLYLLSFILALVAMKR